MKPKSKSQIAAVPKPLAPPSRLSMLGELRTLVNIGSMPLSFVESLVTKQEGSSSLPIILFPGFASDERYMLPLSRYLKNFGYRSEGWGLGVNLAGVNLPHKLEEVSDRWDIEPHEDYDSKTYKGDAGVAFLADKAVERVRDRSEELGSKVVLVGWSLGGYLAREVARDLPDHVAQVITLGAPIIGGPKYTKASAFFESKGHDLNWIERETKKRGDRPIKQPITIIFSKSDAVVNWRATIDKVSPNTTHIEVKASHLGMGFNRGIWRLIRSALLDQDFRNA